MASLGQLSFEPPDFGRFPCLRLASPAAETGGAACIALNAADEVAVGAFLEGTIPFTSIPRTIEAVLEVTPSRHPETIQEVLQLDLGSTAGGPQRGIRFFAGSPLNYCTACVFSQEAPLLTADSSQFQSILR